MDADVIVIGGGMAGLSGATTLARARRRVVVVDDARPRNATAEGVHAYLSRDGIPPGELLRVGREELAAYGASVRAGTATSARRTDDGFVVSLADGDELTARRLLVTSGVVDELPEVPGLAEHWGRDVVHCPFCHGWEVQDRPVGILATGPLAAAHQAPLWTAWTKDLVLFLHEQPEPAPEVVADLERRGVSVVRGRVDRVVAGAGRVVGVEVAGDLHPRTTLVVGSKPVVRSPLLSSLGLGPVDLEMGGAVVATRLEADPVTGLTAVPGVYAAGNLIAPMGQVVAAAAAGTAAAAALLMDLVLTG